MSQQGTASGDRTKIGPDVNRVGDQECQDAEPDEPGRELTSQADAETNTGLEGDPGTHLLDRCHQWKGEERGPQ